MTRRDFLHGVGALSLYAGMAANDAASSEATRPIRLDTGPHLFVDDYLIAHAEGVTRVVHKPQRLPQPVLDNARFGTTQPYLAILRDPDTRRLRMWYNRGPAIWHTESDDGIRWDDPRLAWDVKRGYGVSIVDDRGREKDPNRRFKLANWQANGGSGMYVGFSPDGLRWAPHPGNPVLPDVGDIVDAFYDPLRRRYGCAMKLHARPEDGYAPAPKAGSAFRRLVGMSVSDDFEHWEKPWRIYVPDSKDEGLLEFYGMGGVHARGPLLIGLVRVLRDDLPHEPGGPKEGIGYTVLGWSRDGIHWERDREPFLERNPQSGTWDRAMCWGSGVLPMGNEIWVYYGGYARGHKIAPDKERQIGLARMTRDRYVSRDAGAMGGLLRTPMVQWEAARMTVNADVKGELRIRLLDAAGKPLSGFDGRDCAPIRSDSLAHAVRWKRPLAALKGKPVRLEFVLREGQLYGFELL